MRFSPAFWLLASLALLVLTAPSAHGIIFYEHSSTTHNLETPPGGSWEGAGWQHQGNYRSFLGTMISPRHFVTAKHVGANGTTFTHKSHFSGAPADVVYHLNPNANGGIGFWNIGTTDLRIFEVYGEFPGYASLYPASDEVGKELVMIGRGRTRGTEVFLEEELRGWRWGPWDQRPRWGVNQVDSIVTDLLVCDFDPVLGQEECHATSGDSGGGVFLEDGGEWKLAGILFAVDGSYDSNTICGDGTHFNAALFNALGFFIGSDSQCDFSPVSALSDTVESRSYATRVSSHLAEIQPIIQVAIDDAAKTPTERYEDWIESFGVVSDNLPGEDADQDRQPNVVEYLSALDPSGSDGGLRVLTIASENGTHVLSVRERLDTAARGISWGLEATLDPSSSSWVPVTGLNEVSNEVDAAAGVRIRKFEIPEQPENRTFFRLAVSLAP